MKAFLDTSILVATFYADHERHEPSIDLFLRFGKKQSCCAAHSLAEVYSVVTGMPGQQRVSGDAALLFLGNIRERLTLIALNAREYFGVAQACGAMSLAGGNIYDALLGHCALKANAETIYTWNTIGFSGPSTECRRACQKACRVIASPSATSRGRGFATMLHLFVYLIENIGIAALPGSSFFLHPARRRAL